MRQPDSLQTYTHLLQQAGWEPTSFRLRKTIEFHTDEQEAAVQARLLTVSHEQQPVLSMLILDGVRLPSGMTLYQRYLDMTIEARLGLRVAGLLAPAPYVLIASPYESFLYDAHSEELLLSATSPEEAATRIFLHFQMKEFLDGALDRIPRRNAQQWGKDLADWLRVWSGKLGRAARFAPDVIKPLLAHYLIAWKDTLPGGADHAPDFMGASLEAASEPAQALARPPRQVDFFRQHVRPMTERFPFGIFLAYARHEEEFWHDESIAPLLVNFLAEARLLSRSKFQSANILYALTTEDTERKSWRKALTKQVRIGEWLRRSDLTIFNPVQADIGDDGYGWMMTLLEDLVRYWLEENLKRKQQSAAHRSLGVQLDLFAPPPSGLNASGTLEDILLFVIDHCFRVTVHSADERFNVALLLSLKLAELAEVYQLPLGKFEGIDRIFECN